MKNSLTVATCCYDKDWRLILSEGYLKKVFSRFNYTFNEKLLIINTDNNKEQIKKAAEREIKNGSIDRYFFVSDIKADVCDMFSIENFLYKDKLSYIKKRISRKKFFISLLRNIYYFYSYSKGNGKLISPFTKIYDCEAYSLGPLSAVAMCTSDYLLFFTEDCIMKNNSSSLWIDSGIDLLNKDEHYISSRPIDIDLDGNYFSLYKKNKNFYVSPMFTDRMFLAKADTIRKVDFNCADQGNYPPYGGAGFEAKMYNYMAANNKSILISDTEEYIHEYDEYTLAVKDDNS